MINKAYYENNPGRLASIVPMTREVRKMQRWRRYCECIIHGPSFASTLLDQVRNLPTTDLANVIGRQPILVVAPHPDDESLGCGGLIAGAAELGNDVHIAVVTDGARSHPQSHTHPPGKLRSLRRGEAIEAAAVLGVPAEHVSFLEIPDGHAPQFGTGARIAGQKLAALARGIEAKTIFTSWNYDSHPDHVAAYRYACIAARETGARLFSYPVWAWMLPAATLVPNLRLQGFSIDIGHNMAKKRTAVLRHRSQTTPMITDDPTGFVLSDAHLDAMITSREFFILKSGQKPHAAGLD